VIRWYSPLDGTGERYARSAWVICINCGFSLHIDLRAKMKQFRVDDAFSLSSRLSCPCCNRRAARIVTLRQNGRGEEHWKVLNAREKPPPEPPPPDRLNFLIERQQNSILGQMCARVDNDVTAKAAFAKESERHPDIPLILHIGGHVIATHKWPSGGY
jgi:hypothetical protein